jgi:hypothetical protein
MQSQRSKGGGRLSILHTVSYSYTTISLTDGLDKDTFIDPPIYTLNDIRHTYCIADGISTPESRHSTSPDRSVNSTQLLSDRLIHQLYLTPSTPLYIPIFANKEPFIRSKCTSTFDSTPLYTLHSTLHTSFPSQGKGIGRESTPFLSLPFPYYITRNIVSSLVLDTNQQSTVHNKPLSPQLILILSINRV